MALRIWRPARIQPPCDGVSSRPLKRRCKARSAIPGIRSLCRTRSTLLALPTDRGKILYPSGRESAARRTASAARRATSDRKPYTNLSGTDTGETSRHGQRAKPCLPHSSSHVLCPTIAFSHWIRHRHHRHKARCRRLGEKVAWKPKKSGQDLLPGEFAGNRSPVTRRRPSRYWGRALPGRPRGSIGEDRAPAILGRLARFAMPRQLPSARRRCNPVGT